MLAFVPIACAAIGFFHFLTLFGLASDAIELVSVLDSYAGVYVSASMLLGGLLIWNLFNYRHYLLLLAMARSFRTAILLRQRSLMPCTPILHSAPRAAHGSRDPPFTG
ncbi:hypothetical protein [Microbulbifer sp. TYP-18]|uniref:hypothetical protein n=1 Tax=Microbulbifer sp. TYP-18 TaxID=3230024 RepID=UPI0034C5FD6D